MGQLSQWMACLCVAQALTFAGALDIEKFHKPVVVSVNSSWPLSTVRDTYVSYTIDTSKSMSFNAVNFTEPKLKLLAKLLEPAICRVGGSSNDRLIYTMQEGHYRCWDPAHCLSGEKFTELANFIKGAGAQFVFGLNILYPYSEGVWVPGEKRGLYIRESAHVNKRVPISEAPWNSTNTEALLKYIVKNDLDVYGFELGNEQNVNLSPEETVSRLRTLHDMMKTIYGNENKALPILAGPDTHSYIFTSTQWPAWTANYVNLAKDLVTAVTYHEYVGVTSNETLLSPMVLNAGYSDGLGMQSLVGIGAPKLEVWAGEIGNAVQGGGPYGYTFGTSMWYMDALGMKASIGHTVFARQALFGAKPYTLIGPPPNFTPRPSYYTAVYAKKLLGTIVLAVNRGTYDPALRTYAFCSKEYPKSGGVTLVFVNINKDQKAQVDLQDTLGTFVGSTTREEYHFTASSLESHKIILNKKLLKVNGETGKFEFCDYSPLINSATEPLTIAPHSYTMVVVPRANFKICM